MEKCVVVGQNEGKRDFNRIGGIAGKKPEPNLKMEMETFGKKKGRGVKQVGWGLEHTPAPKNDDLAMPV